MSGYTTFEELLDRDGYLVYTNVGVSMMPLLRQRRDVIVIRKKGPERCKKYDAVLYKRGGRYILHRVVEVRLNDYVIIGDNCWQKEYGVTDDMILGIMTQVRRGGKTVSVDDPGYLRYVHLWCDFLPLRIGILRCIAVARAVVKRIIRPSGGR